MKTKNLKTQTLSKCAQLLILSLLLAMPAWVKGQNWKTIGNTLSATDFIGTNNAQDFRIRTNGTQKAVVTTGGNFGIGTATPAARLDVNGTVKITDGTQSAGKVLTSDANGLASWQTLSIGTSDTWSIIGNSGTIDGTNFIGTTDNAPLNFRVNNQKAGRIDPILNNTFWGYQSGNANTTGYWNTITGSGALFSNTTGYYNTANGVHALYSNTAGYDNVAIGREALYANDEGRGNTAIGSYSLPANTSGIDNTASGYQSLLNNTTGGGNTAAGMNTLYFNTTGYKNGAFGIYTLLYNTSGFLNTAVGNQALFSNADGDYNTAVGNLALSGNISSQYNAALGSGAGYAFEHGYNNVFLGANTNTNADDYYNVIACGQGTIVLNPDTARFGNSATASYGGWADWTNVSDGRFKKNIKENVPGLTFIDKLRPVTYTLDASGLDAFMHKNVKDNLSDEGKAVQQKALHEKEKITYTGFIAQEVEASAKELGFDFSGVDAAKNENDVYGLRYAEFVVPLVKAVQELNAELKKQNEELKLRIEKLESIVSDKTPSNHQLNNSSTLLEQNAPNPFTEETIIKFNIPASAQQAEIKIFAANGKEINSYSISSKGSGQIEISGNTLSVGTYTYMLIIDYKAADSKQMVLTK